MTSQINTNGINVNYPVPGENNSSQGFRDNFAQIRTNLNTGAAEITDLQNKVVLKAALDNSTLNNDMANTLISNASTSGFRATTYNLGNALSGTVLVDVNRADVNYGAVTGDVTFQFGGWAPTNTESNVVLRLSVANAQANIQLPSQCISSNNNFGVVLLENYANISGTATLTAPANTTILEYTFSTVDCGNTITVSPTNRPFQTTQVVTRDPPSTGVQGDTNGTVAVSTAIGQVEATETANTPTVITANTFTSTGSTVSGTTLTIGTLTAGTIATGMLLSNTSANTYIVTNISGSGSGSTWTINNSQTVGAAAINGATGIVGTTLTVGVQTSGTVQEGMVLSGSGVTANTWIVENLSGAGTGSTWRVSATQYATPTTINGNIDVVTVSDTTGFYRDMPITFTGTTFGGITAGTTYYVKEVADGNSITLSSTPGGAMLTLTDASGTMYGNPASYIYVCTDDFNSTVYDTKEATATFQTTNIITMVNTTDLEVNAPIVFTGNVFGGLTQNQVYYIKSISSPNITISQIRVNGVAGSEVLLSTDSGNCIATVTVGTDIWKRIQLTSW
jgi:hypothetical protein